MAVCAQCGRESPDDFGFCPACGGQLGAVATTREVRKVVTVVFCDLTGSTALGDRTDPEALRALMTRYYDAARAVLERHGGTVEKFVGDAVMAVFGIPVASEDDAVRAVRAAVELREGVHDLGLEARIGVNTGQVVAGEGDTLVTGDAVNVGARLEQTAGAGEILLGDETTRLVRDAVDVEQVSLSVKGKSEPVAAYRLLGLDATAAGRARHLERRLIGRERERDRLRTEFADAATGSTCRLFTLIGPAGVGKSRLVADFVEHAQGEARVARGRALSYGEGITYWPLIEILVQLGLEPDEAIRATPADTQLATRALLEELADERPLVLVLDDLQWAEGPLLDLVEHVADWSRDAPIFLLCIARPELLDLRPGWGGGKVNATSVLLEPLDEGHAAALADELLAGVELDGGVRERILETAEGNPLFLEELATFAREAGGAVEVPATIQAVLQARLDGLDEPERSVIERGAVEGKVFHRGAVTALAPEPLRAGVPARLLSLVRKELVRPDRTQIAGDDAYRFRHLLIRDTAYEALPKATRADLHERFAAWLAEHGELLELDEIVGYHLEQAARNLRELDPTDARVPELAGRAAERLGAAGKAAFEREDHSATLNLLGRAFELLPPGPERRSLIPDLFDARLMTGRMDDLQVLVDDLEAGDEHDRATAVVLAAYAELNSGGGRSFDDLEAAVLDAHATLEAAEDEMGLVRAERLLAWLAWGTCRVSRSEDWWTSLYERLRRLGSTSYRAELVTALQIVVVFAGRPVSEVRRRFDELYGDVDGAGPLVTASLRAARARLDYTTGVIGTDELLLAVNHHAELLRQTDAMLEAVTATNFLKEMHWLEGDDMAAEAAARHQVDALDEIGDRVYLANHYAMWAATLCRLGDGDAALAAVERGRALARPDDLADQVQLDAAEAYAWALRGESRRSEELFGKAKAELDQVDMVFLVEQIAYDEAGARSALGDTAGAQEILERLRAAAEARGQARWAERYARDLESVGR
jgi:class 3 adenylate cyclase